MFKFFNKSSNIADQDIDNAEFDIELIAYALAYEVAIADGAIDDNELARVKMGLKNISVKLSQSTEDLFQVIEEQIYELPLLSFVTQQLSSSPSPLLL